MASSAVYYQARRTLNPARGYMLNDSGPIFPAPTSAYNSRLLHQTIKTAWNLQSLYNQLPATFNQNDFGSINPMLSTQFPSDALAYTGYSSDYNFSRFSYERFYPGITQAGILTKWRQDQTNLVNQLKATSNYSYHIPWHRPINDSHCSTIITFIGSHACLELLRAGHEVVVLDNLSNSQEEAVRRVRELAGKDLEFHRADIRDSAALRRIFAAGRIDSVMHFAGLKAVGESVEQPLRYWDNYLSGSLTLFAIMAEHEVKQIVFSSSCTVYGDPASVPIREDFPVTAVNPYGMTKLTIERSSAPQTAAANPSTMKPLTNDAVSFNIKPLMTNVKSPSAKRLIGSVTRRRNGRTSAFNPSRSRCWVSVFSISTCALIANAWTPALTNQTLRAKDRLRTGLKSRATLRLTDQSVLRVNQLTSLEIQAPEEKKKSLLDLQNGAAYFFHRDQPADIEFRTPQASGAIRGTEFNLEVTEDGRTQVVGFHFPGELVGLDSLVRTRYASYATALEDTKLCMIAVDLGSAAMAYPLLGPVLASAVILGAGFTVGVVAFNTVLSAG